VFHEKLGSMAQKVDRMMSIANTKAEHRAIALCKADLLTQMVGEFPELQGIMGDIYAKNQLESHEVCIAIREHYRPVGANDDIPETFLGLRVSFFDKLDSLVGLLGIGTKPTGSKDPFALRRISLSIIRILCEPKMDVLDAETLLWYINTLITAYSDQGISLDPDTNNIVLDFLTERFKTFLTDWAQISKDVISAVIDTEAINIAADYRIAFQQAQKTNAMLRQPGFDIVQEAYKRAYGIVGENIMEITEAAVTNKIMETLLSDLVALETDMENLSVLIKASEAILFACDNVLINDADIAVRHVNFGILSKFIKIIHNQFGRL
jgi:glycyl-tRNA synthetase beta chain